MCSEAVSFLLRRFLIFFRGGLMFIEPVPYLFSRRSHFS